MYPAGRNDPSEIFESNHVSDIAKIRGWICCHIWVNSDRFGNRLLALKYRMKADFLVIGVDPSVISVLSFLIFFFICHDELLSAFS